eukprot:m51a1_g500 hypothetical protein (626) ;mRNA; f:267843-278108
MRVPLLCCVALAIAALAAPAAATAVRAPSLSCHPRNISSDPNTPTQPCSTLPRKFLECATPRYNATSGVGCRSHGPKAKGNATCRALPGVVCSGPRVFVRQNYPCIVMKRHKYTTAIILSMLLGWVGADRFYLGHIGIGVLKMLTLGGRRKAHYKLYRTPPTGAQHPIFAEMLFDHSKGLVRVNSTVATYDGSVGGGWGITLGQSRAFVNDGSRIFHVDAATSAGKTYVPGPSNVFCRGLIVNEQTHLLAWIESSSQLLRCDYTSCSRTAVAALSPLPYDMAWNGADRAITVANGGGKVFKTVDLTTSAQTVESRPGCDTAPITDDLGNYWCLGSYSIIKNGATFLSVGATNGGLAYEPVERRLYWPCQSSLSVAQPLVVCTTLNGLIRVRSTISAVYDASVGGGIGITMGTSKAFVNEGTLIFHVDALTFTGKTILGAPSNPNSKSLVVAETRHLLAWSEWPSSKVYLCDFTNCDTKITVATVAPVPYDMEWFGPDTVSTVGGTDDASRVFKTLSLTDGSQVVLPFPGCLSAPAFDDSNNAWCLGRNSILLNGKTFMALSSTPHGGLVYELDEGRLYWPCEGGHAICISGLNGQGGPSNVIEKMWMLTTGDNVIEDCAARVFSK